jgi:transcriptional regulator with XRE-family HTH domain
MSWGQSMLAPIIGLPIRKCNRGADIYISVALQNYAMDKEEGQTLLGQKVRALRKARGLTQIQLAKALEITQPSLSEIETGQTREISGKVLAGLCRELRAMPDYFMSEEPTSDFGELGLVQQEAVFLLGNMPPTTRDAAIGALRGMAGPGKTANNPYAGMSPAPGPAPRKEKKSGPFVLGAAKKRTTKTGS